MQRSRTRTIEKGTIGTDAVVTHRVENEYDRNESKRDRNRNEIGTGTGHSVRHIPNRSNLLTTLLGATVATTGLVTTTLLAAVCRQL
jgi:hypothetical protein